MPRPALPLLALLVGSIVFFVGFTYLWGAGSDPYTVVENRFFYFTLPVDNTIPHLFGDRLALNQSTHLLIGDWNGGDRPPLQTGFELLFSPVTALLGAGGTMPMGATFALDVFAQYLWLPAGYGLLRMLGFGTRPTIGALVLVSLIPTTMVNTLFTWPKLLSAALVLTSLALLIATRRTRTGGALMFIAAVVAAVMGVLAHGAAAFAIPALVIVGVWALRGRGMRASASWIGLGGVLGLVLYLPWLAYQRFADPPGDRLLKWHLAGVTVPTPDSFVSVLADQYSALPLSEAIHNRLEGLATLIGLDQAHLLAPPIRPLTLVGLRTEDWTSTLFALGAVALGSLLALLIWSVVHRRSLLAADRERLLLIAAMGVCILIWWLVLYSPNATIVAQGSHSWIFVLSLVPVAWMLERAPRAGLALIGVQAVALVGVYFSVVLIGADPGTLSRSALLVGALGLIVLLVLPLALTPPSWCPPRSSSFERRLAKGL